MAAPRSPSPRPGKGSSLPARERAGTEGAGIQPSIGLSPRSGSLPLPQELLFPATLLQRGSLRSGPRELDASRANGGMGRRFAALVSEWDRNVLD